MWAGSPTGMFATWAASNPRLWTAWFIPMLMFAPSWTLFSSRYYDSFNHDPNHDRADSDAIFQMIGFDAENANFLFFLYTYFISPYHFAPDIVAAMDLPGQGYWYLTVLCAQGVAFAARTIYPMCMFGSFCTHGVKFIFTRWGQEFAGYMEALFQYYVFWWIFPKWVFKLRASFFVIRLLVFSPLGFVLNMLSGRNPAMPTLRRQSSSEIFRQAILQGYNPRLGF